jgi:hypothetical protein
LCARAGLQSIKVPKAQAGIHWNFLAVFMAESGS